MIGFRSSLLALVAVLALAAPAVAQFGQERVGTSGFQFLKIPVDARGAALGEAVAASAADASSLFWNPALAAQATRDGRGLAVGLAHTRYHADIGMSYAAGIARVGTPFGTFNLGLSLQSLDGGEMQETTELQPFGTGRTFGYSELAAGLTVSQALTDLFSYGVTAKYVRLSTIDLAAQTAMFDLGIFYRVGETGAELGVAMRNFGVGEATPNGEVDLIDVEGGVATTDEFEGIDLPTQFLLGVTYRLFRANAQHDLLVAGQLMNPSDNQERFTLGAEYTWNDLLILRTGYQFGLEEASAPSFGVGVLVPGLDGAFGTALRLDYGYNRRDRLGDVHRIGLNLQL